MARGAGVSETFVRTRADSGAIPCDRLTDGTRTYPDEAVGIAARLAASARTFRPGDKRDNK